MSEEDRSTLNDALDAIAKQKPLAAYGARPGVCAGVSGDNKGAIMFRRRAGCIQAEFYATYVGNHPIAPARTVPLVGKLAERAGRLIDRKP